MRFSGDVAGECASAGDSGKSCATSAKVMRFSGWRWRAPPSSGETSRLRAGESSWSRLRSASCASPSNLPAIIEQMRPARLGAVKGIRSVSIWKTITPKAHTSLALPYSSPLMSSGDM